jgi:hypothetical protein
MPFQRPCIGCDGLPCPTRALTTDRSGRCEHCRRQHWRSQPTSTERGYGTDHRALREQWVPLVEAGQVICWRCGELIGADEPFDLGHDDSDRTKWRSPEHVACNRAVNSRR